MPAILSIDRFRFRLGERIPDGGDENDTLFTNVELEEIKESAADDEEAVLLGWQAKLATLSTMVDVTEGPTTRRLSQAFGHAQTMVEKLGSTSAPAPSKTTIHRIQR